MQYLYIRQTKSSKKGINIHDQLFTIHTPSGEHQESPRLRAGVKCQKPVIAESSAGAVWAVAGQTSGAVMTEGCGSPFFSAVL